MDKTGFRAAAAALAGARAAHRQLADLDPGVTPANLDEAYAVQDALVAALGVVTRGWKVGCTSPASQQMLGADAPFAGRLMAPSMHDSPATLARDGFFTCGLEAEFAFRLGADLPADRGPFDEAAVSSAVAAVHPAIEVVDGRYVDWVKAGVLKIIADNGAHAASVLGSEIADWRHVDFQSNTVTMRLNEAVVSTGTGANVLGDPIRSLVWLANDRARRGSGLRAGEIVTTGSCCAGLAWAERGDRAAADFGLHGTVSVTFD